MFEEYKLQDEILDEGIEWDFTRKISKKKEFMINPFHYF
ncbi:hypothetical protein ES703_125221 [subsurface metagenome]